MSLNYKNFISLVIGILILLLNYLAFGDLYLSLLTLPVAGIWFLISVIRSVIKKREILIGVLLAMIPIAVGVLVLFANSLQNKYATSNAILIGESLDQFRKDHGEYPLNLEALVPDYMGNIPRAGIALYSQEFEYDRREDQAVCLGWAPVPPFGRAFYWLPAKRWHFLDM